MKRQRDIGLPEDEWTATPEEFMRLGPLNDEEVMNG